MIPRHVRGDLADGWGGGGGRSRSVGAAADGQAAAKCHQGRAPGKAKRKLYRPVGYTQETIVQQSRQQNSQRDRSKQDQRDNLLHS